MLADNSRPGIEALGLEKVGSVTIMSSPSFSVMSGLCTYYIPALGFPDGTLPILRAGLEPVTLLSQTVKC